MSGCKILIIDDDEDDVEILTNAFITSGVDGVHWVNTAMKAFIYLQEVENECLPKLIVTDYYLPGMTGLEFLKDLKGMDKYKNIPIVILSSSKSAEEMERYRKMGALEYLVKPSTYQDYVTIANEIKNKVSL